MNEQAFKDAFRLFVENGYADGEEDFRKLISENPEALNDSYKLFKANGYGDGIEDFKSLIGVEAPKQEEPGFAVSNTMMGKVGAYEPDVKKKVQQGSTESQSEEPSSVSPSKPKDEFQLAAAKMRGEFIPPTGTLEEQAKSVGGTQSYMGGTAPLEPAKKSEKKTYVENLGTNLMSGLNQLNEMIVSVPESAYDLFSIPQNFLSYVTGWDISTNSDKLKKTLGVENPVLDYYKEEGKKLETEIQKFNEENYKSSSVFENIKEGNYGDAFELLGSGIVNSAPVSVAMMLGGATLSPMELAAAGTVGFYGPNQQQLQEENPNASDIENNIKALTMSAAETVFSAVGEGQIGAVYRDIIKKEGVEAGTQVFKTGLVDMYKEAIKKYGIPVGLLGEGLEEAATQITQNMVRNRPAFEGAADAFILGGGSGVAFTAPITLKNAKDRLTNEVAKIDDKKQINTILGNNEAKLHTMFDVAKDSPIDESQFKIASLGKSRDLLVKDLQQNVRKGVITQDQANQSLYVFDKTQQVAGQLRDIDIDEPSKVKVANLLKERESLSEKIQGKDEALSVLEKERIGQINEEIKQTIIDSKAKAQAATPSYSINGKEMTEQEFTKAVSEMSPEDVKKADIKANNATEGVTTLLKEVATRSGVESAPMMETTAPAEVTVEVKPLELNKGDEIKWDVFGNEEKGTWTVGEKVKTRGGQDAVELSKVYVESSKDGQSYTKEYADANNIKYDNERTVTHTVPLSDLQSKIKEENAIQKPTTEEGVLRTEQPQVELPTMGEGNAKGETTQEGVAPAKPQEVKPIEQELAELEQMFPTEGPTGENRGVAASDTKAMEDIASRATDERVQKVIKTAQRLTKTLKSLFPTAEINLHETEESYNGAVEEMNGVKDSNGNFAFGVDANGKVFVRIDINTSSATATDVAHEVAHAVLQKTFGDNQKLFQSFQEKIAKVLSTESNQKLLDFANNPVYKEQGVTYEEYMVQLKALLSEQGVKLELSTAKKIAAVINEYVSRITKGAFKPFQEVTDVKQVVDFVNKVTEAMAKGEEINIEEGGKIGKGSRSSLGQEGKPVEETAEKLRILSPIEENIVYRIIGGSGEVKFYKNFIDRKLNEAYLKLGKNKFSALVRKYIDPDFTVANRKRGNMTLSDVISNSIEEFGHFLYGKDDITKSFLKEAEIEIPNINSDNVNIIGADAIAEKYHKADGSNPELVKAVEDLVGKPTELTSRSSLRTQTQVDDIVKQARASGYSEKAIEEFLNKRGVDPSIIEKSLGKKAAGTKIVTNDKMMPGYDKMMEDVNSEILRGLNRKTKETTIEKNVMKIVESSDAYKNATDQQREQITRDVKEAFGEKIKPAPSAKKILGLSEGIKKITMTLSKYQKQRYEDMEKAEANKEKAIKKASKEVVDTVKELVRKGKITTKQMTAVLRKFAKTNVLSESSVKDFTDYMSKVFNNAEYANKLAEARKLKKIISRASKNKAKDANLTKLAAEFKKIDPAMVEDIDQYNKMASELRNAIKGSSLTKEGVKFTDTVKIAEVGEYASKVIEAQREKYMESLRKEVQDLLGVDASKMSYNEMIKMLNENAKKEFTDEQKEAIIKATKDMFEAHSDTIKKMLETGKDTTGEDIDISKSNKDIVERFMKMDVSKMKILEAIAAVDALKNFIENGSMAKMADVVNKYEGRENSKIVKAAKIVSKPLRLYFSKRGGRGMTEQFSTLPMVFERLFKSPAVGAYVQKMMGVTDLINHKALAAAISRVATKKYTDEFYKKKANGEKFNSSFNDIERGMFADFFRTIVGTPEQLKAEFDRKKGLAEQTIKILKKGTKTQKKKAEINQKVYDKILKNSESIDDVRAKVDPTNVEAIESWVKEWGRHYEKLADVSENVYNRILEKELNYTPVRMSKIKQRKGVESEESAFHMNNGTIFKQKTGSLMESTRPDELPDNRYIDYSFDSKMVNSFHDALIDIYTAADIRKVEAFAKSEAFEDIFPDTEDREMLEGRIQLMVENFRNKNHYDYDELSKAMKYVNKLGNVGVASALTSVFQPIKQTVPVAVNTLVNAGDLNLKMLYSKAERQDIYKFLDESGYAIAIRGKESSSDIKAVDAMIEDVAQNAASKGLEWTTDGLKKLQEAYLNTLLVNPDVAVARMSWITYYEKALKKQGEDVSDIDYSDHELNKDAADYAQKMVDRQQNVSDADLKGKFFSNKDAASQIISKVIFPFASFRMNQSARLASDFITLTSKTTTLEDKRIAASSLAGASFEIAMFNAIGGFSASLLYGIVKSAIAGDDEDEEDKKKREEADEKYIQNLIKGRATSVVQDFLSPLPALDYALQIGVYNIVDMLNGEEKKGKKNEQFNILKPRVRGFLESLGVLGINAVRANDLMNITSIANKGTYEDEYGNTKNIRSKDKDLVKKLIPLAVLNTAGALPTDAYTVQNIILRDIKKQASTQTEAEIIQEKAKKRESRADNIEKIQVINRAINTANDQAVVNELLKMRRETRMELFPQKMSDEAKEVLDRKRKREKASYKGLLGGYDTKTDLKRYDPDLYEQNFGEGSDYYDTHEAEVKAEKLFDAMMKKTKDEQYGYTPKPKKKSKSKRKRNSDGSYKSSYFRSSSR